MQGDRSRKGYPQSQASTKKPSTMNIDNKKPKAKDTTKTASRASRPPTVDATRVRAAGTIRREDAPRSIHTDVTRSFRRRAPPPAASRSIDESDDDDISDVFLLKDVVESDNNQSDDEVESRRNVLIRMEDEAGKRREAIIRNQAAMLRLEGEAAKFRQALLQADNASAARRKAIRQKSEGRHSGFRHERFW